MEEIEKNHQWWQEYANAYDMIAKDHADRGEPLPDYYPHPDELNFPKDRFVTGWFGGEPIQAAILRAHYIRLRDLLLLQSEKDRRYFGSECELDHISGKVGAFINAILPRAAQLDDANFFIRLSKQNALRKPELQRRLTAAWADIGHPAGKDLRTPSLDEAAMARVMAKLRERLAPRESR